MDAFLAVAAKLAGGLASMLVAAFVYAILAGRLVPRSAIDDVRADRDARLAEIRKELEDWRDTVHLSQATNQVLADQVRELIELGRTTNDLIKALPGPPPPAARRRP